MSRSEISSISPESWEKENSDFPQNAFTDHPIDKLFDAADRFGISKGDICSAEFTEKLDTDPAFGGLMNFRDEFCLPKASQLPNGLQF